MNLLRRRAPGRILRRAALACALSVLSALSAPSTAATAAAPEAAPPELSPRAPAATTAVPAAERDAVLGKGWRSSTDRAWTLAGDGDGLHLLVADAADGYAWRTAATFTEPGVEADQWIGNACVTASGRRAVVVYAPRTFTNRQVLFDRGGFAAVADLERGSVRKLAARVSLAYFNPACGAGEAAVLTQAGDQDLGRTRLLRLDAGTGRVTSRIEVPGQLTSAVPTPAGIVAADGGAVVRVARDGTRRVLARAASVPFRLAADADGGVVYLERSGKDRAVARRLDGAAVRSGRGAPATLTSGGLTTVDVTMGRGGRVFVTGAPRDAAVPAVPSVSLRSAPAGTRMSLTGQLAVTSVVRSAAADPRAPVADPGAAQPVTIKARAQATSADVTFDRVPTGANGEGRRRSPALTAAERQTAGKPAAAAGRAALAAGDPNNPADFAERYCSVPRNDPRNQAMQPKPRQVEWAVDQAVRNSLYVQRPANWKNLGMPAYRPQDLFPPLALSGGGYVPAQVMLAITAQESNMWQAARYAVPGVTANPLIGNYYGLEIYNAIVEDDWMIRWDHADCGYGVTQVTDGMRLAGREKPGETAMPYDSQRAVALDFAANVAAGLRILQSKWNQTRDAGLIINNGDPSKLENWFFAVWAYNSGFYPQSQAGANSGAWGVGWANNPANPKYPANRGSFLETDDYQDDYRDASHPQDWPYPEKIMGWAGHPVEVLEAPDTLVVGYRAAWWNGGDVNGPINRHHVAPPHDMFCDFSNNCEWGSRWLPDAPEVIGEPAGPCNHRNANGQIDLKCWYHRAAGWKPDCAVTCGNELLRFNPGFAYQEDGTAYPPKCDLSGLPSNAQVIDDVPDGTPSIRPDCFRPWTNAGTFNLTFKADANGQYPGKIDTHQLGMGLGGHFWRTSARKSTDLGGLMEVVGTWRFNQARTGLGTLYAHLPHMALGSQETRYKINTAYGTRTKVVNQRGSGNRWVSLGTYRFNGAPEVTLSTEVGTGPDQPIAFDALAFVPVNQTRTIKVLNWNIAGAAKNEGDYYVVDRLVQEVLLRRPDALTLNEVCENQYLALNDRLAAAGYAMAGNFYMKTSTNLTCFNAGTGRYAEGNAVFVRATAVASQDYGFDESNKLVEGRTGEGRGLACITGRFAGATPDVKVCAMHLETGYPADQTAGAQVREIAAVFGEQARQMPVILAGDTNINTRPNGDGNMAHLYGPYGDFNEVEQERACEQTPTCELSQGGSATYRDQKLDYIFASHGHFHVPVGRAFANWDVGECGSDNHPCSDHAFLVGEVQLPTG
jgi:endonuclease/exonuclease/phosphatase family metal-dependent hydrolase